LGKLADFLTGESPTSNLSDKPTYRYWCVLNVGLLDGLLGVAGMMTLLVMTGIIPEDSLRLAPVSLRIWPTGLGELEELGIHRSKTSGCFSRKNCF